MAEYVRMPKAHYEAACNSIRAKTGKTDLIKSGAMSAEIDSITAGGGSSDDVRYVTFMNHDGTVEYGKKAVAVGDDCADPIARGIFDTPTRESTAQYNYTFAGWATTANGGLDSNALKSVTEDRTVYANFASVLRYYTITYYDGDTVLKTESLAYGATPSYTPEKDGYGFEGWNPVLTTVTREASYTAVWAAKVTFANGSWADIAEICEAGEAANYFAIGDTKTITLSYSDGTTENLKLKIADFNHDDLADGSGKAGISIICAQAITHSCLSVTENTSYGKGYVWGNSQTRTVLNSGELYTALPAELRKVIKEVKKISNGGLSADYGGYAKNVLYTTTDKVWLPSFTEVGFAADSNVATQGTRYPIYNQSTNNTASDTSRTVYKTNGSTTPYALRSMYTQYANSCCSVTYNGSLSTQYYLGSGMYGVTGRVFGFCV